jgi:hypothetical protein
MVVGCSSVTCKTKQKTELRMVEEEDRGERRKIKKLPSRVAGINLEVGIAGEPPAPVCCKPKKNRKIRATERATEGESERE